MEEGTKDVQRMEDVLNNSWGKHIGSSKERKGSGHVTERGMLGVYRMGQALASPGGRHVGD